MTRVSRLLDARAHERPDAVALLDGVDGRRLRWRDLAVHAARWEERARASELAPRRRVALALDDPLSFGAAYLGCLAAGLAVVPLDPRGTAAELEAAVARLRVDVLVTGSEDAPAAASVERWSAGLDGPRRVCPAPPGPRPSDAAARRPAALLASSGTTGAPKGVPLSEHQLLLGAARVVRHHRLGPTDRGHTPLPLFHVNAQVVGLLATLLSGGSLVVEARFERDGYWDRVAAARPTWLNTVPAVLAALAEIPAPPGAVAAGLRFARSASAPLPVPVLERFEAHTGVAVLETYGMTETAGQITANPLEPGSRRPGSVGRPAGVELWITTPDGRRAAPGEVGAVRLRGAAVVTEYLELTEEGPERVRPARDGGGWLPTGDLGVCDESGFVRLLGREDDVINRGGEKFHPLEVESVLLGHPAVAGAVVVGAPHPRLGQVAVAFVTLHPGAPAALTEELTRACAERLVRYKRPVEIRVALSLPVGPTGKVRRRELRSGLAA
jgi:acyl-CoA synthetase (AMP-forming)/AMP-acid ligase II